MIKRVFDILFSLTALILVSPIFLPIALLLICTGEHKVFYIQERVGKNKKAFGLIKFATMLENSSNMTGGDVTTQNDPRVLPAGKFLRKTKINELPQFINILKGDMSVVGPRPTTFKNYSYYSEEIQLQIKSIKPGLTGIGSIIFRNEEVFVKNSGKDPQIFYKEEIAPFKGELEVWYSKNQSFFTDIRIIFITIFVVLNSNSNLVQKQFKNLPEHHIFLKPII